MTGKLNISVHAANVKELTIEHGTTNKKSSAVIISDVHYSLQTLEVADKAMTLAIDKANELNVRLIVAGDLHDTKANLRAECINDLINTLKKAKKKPIILRGNHDSINEKSIETALEFLRPYAYMADDLEFESYWLLPYQHNPEQFKVKLDRIPKGSTVFCHQGVIGSNSGHYIQDKSAVPSIWLDGYRVISGHYHQRQDIKCGETGLWSYVGNPYSLGFGEVNDSEKGFQILYDDGSLEFVPTKLRRHKIIVWDTMTQHRETWTDQDILWVKVCGASDRLAKFNKTEIAKIFQITQDFRLDLIPLETKSIEKIDNDVETPQTEILDNIIDSLTNTTEERKLRLKGLWKKFI